MATATPTRKPPPNKKVEVNDVLSFAEYGLELPLYDWQLQANLAIDKGSTLERIKVAVVAPNGSGKTERVVAVSALRWLNRHPRGRVVVTSADSKQLDSQLIPALHRHRHRFPKWEFLLRGIRTPQGGFLLAFSTDDAARAEGHHAAKDSPLLVICDEAKSIQEEIFTAFDRCSYNTLLYISSPGLMQGRFYDAFSANREQFLCLQAGLTDCPHISKERIDDTVATYGEDKPFTRSTLYGEFMEYDEATNFVFNYQQVMAVVNNPPHARPSRHEHCGFCDFAAGGDENVLAIRSGNQLLDVIAWRERDTSSALGRFIIEFRRAGLKPEQIWADAGGLGIPMCNMLRDAGWPINRFNGGLAASNGEAFISRNSEIWHDLSARVNKGEVCLLNDPVLISQLTTRKITYDARGRVGLEKKDDMRSRGLKSPDRADAVCGAFAHGVQSFATFVKRVDMWDEQNFESEVEINGSRGGDRQFLSDLGAWTGD
jgi:hypothetical protein